MTQPARSSVLRPTRNSSVFRSFGAAGERFASPALGSTGRSEWRAGLRLLVWLAALCAGFAARGDLALTNFSATNLLKVMAAGDSITDDCSVNGAWRQYLQPLLETNGYPFTFVGRYSSYASGKFNKVKHEGICGAVVAAPGLMPSPVQNYSGPDTYLQLTLIDALTNVIPDLLLVYIGVNDIGRGRDPYTVATNHLPALLDSIFARAPAANVILTKVTTLRTARIGSPPYKTYSTNIAVFNTAVQTMVNARRALGQNVFVADMFSAVDPTTGLQGDRLHPNPVGLNAIAREFLSRIEVLTLRTNRAVTCLVPGCSDWAYSDQGLDLGTNWALPRYNDSAWSRGPGPLGYGAPGIASTLGYGPVSTNRHITTYFRRRFVAPAAVHYTNLNFRLNRADGAAVWLNGREMFRMNLPAHQPLSCLARATTVVTNEAVHTYYQTNIPVSFLPPGTNVLAVEIHKFAASAPSLSFDLELFGSGDYAPPAPPLFIARDGTDVRLRWPAASNAGFALFSGGYLLQPASWLPVGGPCILAGGFYEYQEPLLLSAPSTFYQLFYLGLPATPPRLGIRMDADAAVLSWGSDFAGFHVETAAALSAPGAWQTLGGPYTLSQGRFQARTPGTSVSNAFFRLVKPSL
ncbi:MAG TPA: GDSL-type esterase/lipase family protein [Verrucomicrobiota bacterium]|nr:GDSL-type esterase/lipase family protein [Verrucomicrobiota bacterium]HQL76773.1 GDSL-type esterase/lipase family protein [Verrucomicrobiota bacterium]